MKFIWRHCPEDPDIGWIEGLTFEEEQYMPADIGQTIVERLNAMFFNYETVVKYAERYEYLRDATRVQALDKVGPGAGVFCEIKDAEGITYLLTEDDLDDEIDMQITIANTVSAANSKPSSNS